MEKEGILLLLGLCIIRKLGSVHNNYLFPRNNYYIASDIHNYDIILDVHEIKVVDLFLSKLIVWNLIIYRLMMILIGLLV